VSYELRSIDPETGHVRAVESIEDEQLAWISYAVDAAYVAKEGGHLELVRMSDGEKLATVCKVKRA
jgi:hypothetical protein